MAQNDSKWLHIAPNVSKLPQMAVNCLKWLLIASNISKYVSRDRYHKYVHVGERQRQRELESERDRDRQRQTETDFNLIDDFPKFGQDVRCLIGQGVRCFERVSVFWAGYPKLRQVIRS